MARTTTEADTARLIGVNQKTLQRWREPSGERPAVPHTMVGKRPFYDVAEVRAWMLQWGVTGQRPGSTPPAGAPPPGSTPPAPGSVPPPDDGAAAEGASGRAQHAIQQAGLAATRRKEAQRQAKVREGMASLGLGAKIRSAQTEAEVLAFVRELAALQAEGRVLPGDARALRETATEVRQTLKLQQKRAAPEQSDRAVIATAEAVPLLQMFEGITDKARRDRVLAFCRATAEEDRALGPRSDTGEPGQDVA